MNNFNHKPYVIGIAGSSGSGKTFFLNCFLNHFSNDEITLISQDNYYIPAHTKTKEENRLHNFDLPTAIDRKVFFDDISSLIEGNTVHRKEYTFNNPAVLPKRLTMNPASILIIEGLFIFHYEEIDALLDYRIFMEAREDIALQRRLKRDFIERGYDEKEVMFKWNNHVVPAFKRYLLPYKSKCNLVIKNNRNDGEDIITISKDISSYLRKAFF